MGINCKKGRIKKRTSAGGCQTMRIDKWYQLRGFNENMIGWGSEDVDLLKRAIMMGQKVIWMGENIECIELFHQHHEKVNIGFDLQCQNKNKKIFESNKQIVVNDSWGGKNHDDLSID